MRLKELFAQGGGTPCPREEEILAAHRGGALPDAGDLQAHLAGCESCHRAVRVSSALSVLAAEGPGFRLPEPHQVLWRARVMDRFARREAATERATRPLRWVAAAAALLVTAMATLLTSRLLEGVMDAGWWFLAGGEAAAVLRLGLWLGIALLALTIALATTAVFQER